MRHNEDSAILKPLTQRSLDQVVRFQVDVGCGLVEHQDMSFSNDCAGQAYQLLLADRKQVVAFRNVRVQVLLQRINLVVHFDFLEDCIDLRVRALLERIQVLPNRPLNQEWTLRDVGDGLAENVQPNRFAIDAIDESLADLQLDEAEQSLQNGALA